MAYLIDSPVVADGYNYTGHAVLTATNFPSSDLPFLYDNRKSHAVQATAKTGLYINLDIRSASLDVDMIAILGHNLASDATIKIQADDDSGYGSLAVDQTLTWNEDQIVYFFDTVKTYRYWRLSIEASNNVGYPFIGEFLIGKKVSFTFPMNWGITEQYEHLNVSHKTDYGVEWVYTQGVLRSFQAFNFITRPEDEVEEVEDMIIAANGSLIPVLLTHDLENYPNRAIYGHLADELQRTFVFDQNSDVTGLTIQEEPSAKMIEV